MNSQKNNYILPEIESQTFSNKEKLLLNYDAYLQGSLANALTLQNYYSMELEEDLEDDFEAEYDENDWEEEEEEEEENDDEEQENDENVPEPETFSDDGLKVD